MKAELKGIGFDLDGTLIDSMGLSATWMAAAASKAVGRTISEKEVRAHFGLPELQIFRALFPALAEAAFAHYQEILSAQVSQIRLFDQVTEVFTLLEKKKIPATLFTMRGRWATDKILAHHGLRDVFVFTLTGDEVKKIKPDPEGILRQCEALKVSPKHFVYVGDTDFDVQAAQRAGAGAYQAMWADGVQRYGNATLKSLADLRLAIERGRLGAI